MNFLNKQISTNIILDVFTGLAIAGMVFILLSVNRMNSVLSADLGFNKDSVLCIKTDESSIVLPGSFVFSSVLPGFYSEQKILVKSGCIKKNIEIAHQYVSKSYFKLFNYTKLNEKSDLFSNHGSARLIYVNESAVKNLGFSCVDDASGAKIKDNDNNEYMICGVVKDFTPLTLRKRVQPKIYQLSSEHLEFASCQKDDIKPSSKLAQDKWVTFQKELNNHYKMMEDMVYSMFLFINVILLLICLGYVGSKYTQKKEGELSKTLGTGVHVLTLIISKTYGYLIAVIGFIAIPLAFIIKKTWLEIYVNRVSFGAIDIFIILSMALLAIYLVCCPKNKLLDMLKGTAFHSNSI